MRSHFRHTKTFYDLPRDMAVHIFSFLPLPALLGAQLVSKRFYTLTNGKEFKHCFFLSSPPLTSILPSTKILLHPVFERLNFSAYHSPKIIRIGKDLDSLSLYKAKVGKQFVTYPPLKNVVIRVLSGGIWPFSVEIMVENDGGVTVWDVINETTTFFKSYTKISFADRFGLDICEERGYDPKVLMQNYDFLDPKMPFPKILFLDRNNKNTIIADYEFNKFASLPLIKRPADWSPGDGESCKTEGVTEESLCGDSGKNSDEEEAQEPHDIKSERGATNENGGLVDTQEVEKAGEMDLNDDQIGKEPSTSASSTAGSEPMDMVDEFSSTSEKGILAKNHILENFNHSTPALQDVKEVVELHTSGSPGGASTQIGNITNLLESHILEENKVQDSDSYTTGEFAPQVTRSTPLTYQIEPEAVRVEPTSEKQALSPVWDGMDEPSILDITLAETSGALTTILSDLNLDAGNKDDNLGSASNKAWIAMEEESDDWDDAFA